MRPYLFFGLSFAAACSSRIPCDGSNCATLPGTLTLHVLDAQTSVPIAAPSFIENGQSLPATCGVPADAGACTAWVFSNSVGVGSHTITVHAGGYRDQTVQVLIEGPPGCCGSGPSADETVSMTAR